MTLLYLSHRGKLPDDATGPTDDAIELKPPTKPSYNVAEPMPLIKLHDDAVEPKPPTKSHDDAVEPKLRQPPMEPPNDAFVPMHKKRKSNGA
jgi:hypothetical protein